MDSSLAIHCLHLADSNRPTGIIAQIIAAAEKRQVAVRYHDRQALSRISKNGRQDQGVALDVICPGFLSLEAFLALPEKPRTLLAIDGVTNPQNVGMIIRSAAAAAIDGLLYPKRGIASLGPLVIKASAGNVFRAPIIRCETTTSAVSTLKTRAIASPFYRRQHRNLFSTTNQTPRWSAYWAVRVRAWERMYWQWRTPNSVFLWPTASSR